MFGWGGAGAVTSEGLIQVLLAKDNVEVVHSARVELHAENHVAGRAAKLLVVTLQLRRGVGTAHQDEPPGQGKGELGGPKARGPPVPQLLPARRAEPRLLTKISPLRSKPGSMVMQMPVWLSPCTLLQRERAGGHELWCRVPPRAPSATPTSPFHPKPATKGAKHGADPKVTEEGPVPHSKGHPFPGGGRQEGETEAQFN